MKNQAGSSLSAGLAAATASTALIFMAGCAGTPQATQFKSMPIPGQAEKLSA
jgi:hypothetical protein